MQKAVLLLILHLTSTVQALHIQALKESWPPSSCYTRFCFVREISTESLLSNQISTESLLSNQNTCNSKFILHTPESYLPTVAAELVEGFVPCWVDCLVLHVVTLAVKLPPAAVAAELVEGFVPC